MTDTPMTPDRKQEIRAAAVTFGAHPELGFACCSAHDAADAVPDLLAEVDRLRAALSEATDQVAELESDLGGATAETAALKQRLHEAAMARVWTNEDGKKFVFVDDIKGPLLGTATGAQRGRARLDEKTVREAEDTHWRRLGVAIDCQGCGALAPAAGTRVWHRIGCPKRETR